VWLCLINHIKRRFVGSIWSIQKNVLPLQVAEVISQCVVMDRVEPGFDEVDLATLIFCVGPVRDGLVVGRGRETMMCAPEFARWFRDL